MSQHVALYEVWQMKCCGVPFKIGDAVKWLVRKLDYVKMPVDVGEIHYCYEAHNSDYKKLFMQVES